MKLALAILSRPNWGTVASVAKAAQAHPDVELEVWCGASALSDRFGNIAQSIEDEGYTVVPVYGLAAGDEPGQMTRTTALMSLACQNLIEQRRPETLLVVGDRHEVLAPAAAAAYSNVRLAHVMGGEQSGTIDDKVRDAITCLSDLHFVATMGAGVRVADILGRQAFATSDQATLGIHVTGCPRIDRVREALRPERLETFLRAMGLPVRVRAPETPGGRPLMLYMHADTTLPPGQNHAHTLAAAEACELVSRKRDLDVHAFWPNADSRHMEVVKALRQYEGRSRWSFHRAMSPEDYWRMMASTACLVGNTSSGIREGAYIGTPYVCLGDRQKSREHARNVVTLSGPLTAEWIAESVEQQVDHGRYESSNLYGDGHAAERIVEVLAS